MKETSKCYEFRKERGDFDRYLLGYGIDIGAGDDPLQIPAGLVVPFDTKDGDATFMQNVPERSFDFVYSSHCLEHLSEVKLALTNWIRILKPGGILYIVVPEFVLYEKCCFPSCFNGDHKSTFSLFFDRMQIGRDSHYGWDQIRDLLWELGIEFIVCQVECNGYDFTQRPEIDQTLGSAIAQICFIGKNR